jgi:tryptophan-rich sensory protein
MASNYIEHLGGKRSYDLNVQGNQAPQGAQSVQGTVSVGGIGNQDATGVNAQVEPYLILSRNIVFIIGTAIIVVYATMSSQMVATDGQWYLSLKKPSWQPPNIVFGIIWPYNFAMLVGATWIVATRLSTTHRLIWLIFLALSVTSSLIWAWLFFMSHLLLASSIALLFATLFTTPLLVISFQASPALGIAFVPYQIWLALATSLSFGYSDQ